MVSALSVGFKFIYIQQRATYHSKVAWIHLISNNNIQFTKSGEFAMGTQQCSFDFYNQPNSMATDSGLCYAQYLALESHAVIGWNEIAAPGAPALSVPLCGKNPDATRCWGYSSVLRNIILVYRLKNLFFWIFFLSTAFELLLKEFFCSLALWKNSFRYNRVLIFGWLVCHYLKSSGIW